MLTPQNHFKNKLSDGLPQLGFWLALANPDIAEICAGLGYDWVLIDAEHGAQTLPGIAHQLRAVDTVSDCSAIVRVPGHDPVTIHQILDLGAQTIMVPMVDNATQAASIVKASRYPPDGDRGIGGARAARWGRFPAYVADANEQLCIIAQIETAEAIKNLEAIAAVDGIDALFIGPADLAASLGLLGPANASALAQATGAALDRIRATGIPCGILSRDERLVQQYLEGGARFLAVGIDSFTLAKAAGDLARDWRCRIDTAVAGAK
ncbi:HpcH/HpaI aldolase/citrate lyase family protein [Sphingobium sp. AR-3-1]|uniref:2-dehydro-3-deoxyglucarate aldolase n=2 Tax=Sphingobium TaxID=165695 RepID=A0A418YP67_9SPHN|nr:MULTISPECIES: HpcH/HpaI aldolase/citrate lyase family protein [Sphingobium]NML13107.1 HpcH/HpaI aldolase/citrate lyase family protein [Sphingobium psychrophilum]PBN41519.1 2-dehydro-3-deoxyglucarate aldolase [Sphingobium sp. D43FB]RJG53068.1 2-dehydro-3-deoxyglucarate aldolase [Sphingobium terrigena]